MEPYELVADPDEIKSFELYPGLSGNQHLYNKSALVLGYMPPPDTENDRLRPRAMTIVEVNIRSTTKSPYPLIWWCNSTDMPGGSCVGSMNHQYPYASIYNKEPGIPLSIKSPKMILARFSMEAGTIV